MSYTVLRKDAAGVWFRAHHLERLRAAGPAAVAGFERFCESAEEGIYAVRAEPDGTLRTERRAASRLREGMPVRYAVSPFADRQGPFPKPAPPNAYAAVRREGVVTLLTDPRGSELYEACSAGVVAWTGAGWIVPPREAPRVDSVAERALWASGRVKAAPIGVGSGMPLVLINAVVGALTLDPVDVPLPPAGALAQLLEVFRATAR